MNGPNKIFSFNCYVHQHVHLVKFTVCGADIWACPVCTNTTYSWHKHGKMNKVIKRKNRKLYPKDKVTVFISKKKKSRLG